MLKAISWNTSWHLHIQLFDSQSLISSLYIRISKNVSFLRIYLFTFLMGYLSCLFTANYFRTEEKLVKKMF